MLLRLYMISYLLAHCIAKFTSAILQVIHVFKTKQHQQLQNFGYL
jgi:hypothetical protein